MDNATVNQLPTTKVCTGPCGRDLPLSEYTPTPRGKFGCASRCRECLRSIQKQWRVDNPDKEKAKHERHAKKFPNSNREKAKKSYHKNSTAENRERRLIQLYGMTQADYDRILAEQGGRCLICEQLPVDDNDFHIDHDHASEEKGCRGILCRRCNIGLGHFRDNQKSLVKAALYLDGIKGWIGGYTINVAEPRPLTQMNDVLEQFKQLAASAAGDSSEICNVQV